MAGFKGFSAQAKEIKSNKKVRLSDPKLTLKFEKYVALELGRNWNNDCLLVAAEGAGGIVKLAIPVERQSFFTSDILQKLETMAKSFGLKKLNIEQSNLSKASLIRRYSGIGGNQGLIADIT